MPIEYTRVMQVHPLYERNRLRYQFLLNSYLGGDSYRRANYLTRYNTESENDYQMRLETTPVDNHCRSVVQIYNAFLFRQEPDRDYGTLITDPSLEAFLADADLEGRDFNGFMKDAATYAAVFGHTWVLVSKPATQTRTRAEELNQAIRPYVSLVTPINVLDWAWERAANGVHYLSYLKIAEDNDDGRTSTIREWTEEQIISTTVDNSRREASTQTIEPNELGIIPAVLLYAQRGPQRGIGISDIEDIATAQRTIYNFNSEVEQGIRLSVHPSLVKTVGTEAVAGAGAIVQIEDNLDPGLKPYLLETSGDGIESIHKSIKEQVLAIDRMANLGSARAQEVSTLSGVAMETEFQMLNARLADKADNLEFCEENIWALWSRYQGRVWDGEINYPDSFNIRDEEREIRQLAVAKNTATDPKVLMVIDYKLLEMMGREPEKVLTNRAPDATKAQKLKLDLIGQVQETVQRETGNETLDMVLGSMAIDTVVTNQVLRDQIGREYAGEAVDQTALEQAQQSESATAQMWARAYPDGEPVSDLLPAAYVPADTEGVPEGQNCGNCEYWDDITGNCSKWDAPVRATYWCRKWDDAIED